MSICAVIGATGYAGAELARLLLGHPDVEELVLSSASARGEAMSSVYPNLAGAFGKRPGAGRGLLVDKAEAIGRADVIFAALPAGHAEDIAAACTAKGALFIDMSADFRFGSDEATYSKWYGKSFALPELHAASVYGLPELNRAKIAALGPARAASSLAGPVIGNPGCYPTASTLGLFPALRLGLAAREGIIIDAKSGVTGAGKEPTKTTHYSECRRFHHALQDRRAPAWAGNRRRPRGDGRLSGRLACSCLTSPRWGGASSRRSTSVWRGR